MQRGTSITALGIMSIVFGGLSALVETSTMALLFHGVQALDRRAPLWQRNPILRDWVLLSGTIGILVALLFVAGGIGLILQRRWGRSLSIGCAIYWIAAAFTGLAIGGAVNLLDPTVLPPGTGRDAESFLMGQIFGRMLAQCLVRTIYPVALLHEIKKTPMASP
jgi:hypothetical protein